MNANWIGFAAAAVSMVLFHWTRKAGGKLPLRRRMAVTAFAFLFALPGASFAFHYTHLLPETAWYLARFARRQGTEVRFTINDGFAPEGGLPAIAGVKLGSIGHFIAILSEQDGNYLVGDPLVGPRRATRAELEAHYNFTGFHLRVERKAK